MVFCVSIILFFSYMWIIKFAKHMSYYYDCYLCYPTGQALHFFNTSDITPQLKYGHQPAMCTETFKVLILDVNVNFLWADFYC